ncbi:1-propanol dehydrogenase PduQ [Cohaesibacter celericrescens]|uniref:Alcohol dehydrogenase 2 n=1 Tax=Cohaesibacter celericrescens TaxID=2067669 RepID=A0A2N5XQR5_9HYPH|nr:1-propanol dehydrogenase PduQ [Cohaesibacter celericrescens]PLW76843.1 alcohol dehydrogenase [Cohaesibacter celericrescens]
MARYQCFYPKTEIVFGPDLLERLHAYSGQKVGIVTDAFMVKSGALDRVQAYLGGSECLVFDEAIPEPPVQTVSKGASLFSDFDPDVLIGLGGGSAIDAAKAILAVVREVKPDRRIQLVAIPTTSGTGSEVTAYAVISDPENGKKIPLVSRDLVPDVALLDPEFVRTAPLNVTVDSGMDVITHAIEAIVATGANHFTDACAEKALELAFAFLPKVYADGNDLAARDAMHQASCLAGLAFTASGLGINHGLAHAIGGQMHIVHGRINAMLMPIVIEYNAGLPAMSPDCRPTAEKYARIAKRIGLHFPSTEKGVYALVHAIEKLNAKFGIPKTMKAHGVDMNTYARSEQTLVNAALADACTATNPRKPTAQDLTILLHRVGG